MAYLGTLPSVGEFRKVDNISSQFNGSTTQFTLTKDGTAFIIGSAQNLILSIDGVVQEPGVAFTVDGSTITFTEAPETGASFFAVQLGSVYAFGVPTDEGVTTSKLAANAVTTAKIADEAITTAKIAANAVVTADIAEGAITTARLSDNAVARAKIQDAAISASKLDTDAVTTTAVLANAITTAKIAESAVTSARLADSAVTTAKININSDLNFNSANIDRAGLGETNVSSVSNILTLNYANSTVFISQFFQNTTLTPNNVPAGGCVMLLKANNAGAYTISYAGNVRFASNTAPTLTASAQDYIYLVCDTDTRYFVTAQTNVVQNK